MGAGVRDLVGLPLRGVQEGSAGAFVWGVGAGTTSLVRHISGWTLSSIAGFSSSVAHILDRASGREIVSAPASPACLARSPHRVSDARPPGASQPLRPTS